MKNARGKTCRLGNTLLILALVVSLSPPLILSAQPPGTGVFINEIHYDNDGTDAGEAIEIAGPAGTDLTGWSLVLYNGNGGAMYNTTTLSGAIPDQQNGYGTAYWPISGIQNGSPDGMALVDASSTVIQFLSYEGTFSAVDGPAAGMTSVDIGVLEESTTPAGFSLQLSGTGTAYADFAWGAPAASTFGAVNAGQTFTGAGPDYTPIYDIQYTADPSGDSPYDGQEVTTEGIVTAVFYNGYFIEDPAGGPWTGLWVYDANAPALGDRVRLTGTVAEYYGLTELASLTSYAVESSGNPLPEPVVVTTGAANAEQYEGVLLRVQNVQVTAEEDGYSEWQVDDGSGPLMVDNLGADTYVPVLGETLAAIIGPLNYSYDQYKIAPRDDNDIIPAGPDYTPIYDIQYTADPSGDSPYVGQEVTTEGIVTAAFYSGYFIEDPAGGPWTGLWVYDANAPALGDRVRLTGTVAEYYGLTELASLTFYAVESSGNPLPDPVVVTTGAANAEQYEGVLLRVQNVQVTAEEDGYSEWQVDDGSGPLMVDNLGPDTYVPVLGETLAAIIGPLNYSYDQYKIAPRDDNDILLPSAAASLVINEIDYDQPSTDTAEFVEIRNNGDATVDLAGWVLELVNGTGGGAAVYQSFDLSGYSLAAADYFVLCGDAATVPNCDLDVTPESNLVQNGAPDAVALRFNGDLIDAVSYEGDTGAPYTEGSGAGLEDGGEGSISRCPDGVDTNANNVDLVFTAASTPGAANACVVPVPEVDISEIRIDQTGTDNDEYFELTGLPGTALDGLTYLVIGDGTGGSGVIEAVVDLSGQVIPASGYFVAAESTFTLGTADLTTDLNFENSDNVTHLLVSGFTGANGDDLDTNDDGVLDVLPWEELLDLIALIKEENPPSSTEYHYGPPTVGPDGEYVPGHAFRCPAGWRIGAFDPAGGSDTPGAANACEGCGEPFTPICQVQGSGAASPLVGTDVSVEGIVVGDFQNNAALDNGDLNGFYVQDPAGDGDAITSDGIFVYAPGGMDVSPGDSIRVRGSVSEYRGLTEITAGQIWICSTGNSVAPAPLSLPVTSVDDLEAYEGMLVTFPQALYISEYFNFDRYGEIVLTSERQFQPTAVFEPGSPEAEQLALGNLLGRITLDDGRTTQNSDPALHPNGLVFDLSNLFRGGGTLQNVTGVVDQYNAYRIQSTQGAEYTAANPRSLAPDGVGGTLKVASFNVLNYFTTIDTGDPICGPDGNMECRGADTEEEFTRQKAKIVAALAAIDADVVGLIEIENHPGDVPTADLVAGLNDVVGAGTYHYVATGAIGTDAIRQAFIYKPATVSLVGGYAVLDDPSFTDPVGYGQQQSRPALAQSFMDNTTGGLFTVVVNHLKSKGSACGVGDDDPVQGNCNLTRTLGAQALIGWLATDPTGSGDADALIIGDLNAYDKEDPVAALLAGGYTDLVQAYGGDYAYSYVFDGQLGYLDHALANPDLLDEVTGTTVWHINADEPDLIDYDMTFKQDAQDAIYAPDAYRSSDHDPVIVGLDVSDEVAPAVTLTGPGTAAEGDTAHYSYTVSGDPAFDTFVLDGTSCGAGGLLSNSVFDAAAGAGSFDCTFPNGPVTTVVSVTVSDDDGDSGSASLLVSVANVAPSVEAGVDQQVFEDTQVHLDPASFSDPGAGDTHSAIIDWGDGTVEPGSVDQENHAVAGSHVYAGAGIYTVTVTVEDSDGDSSSDSLTITVLHGFMRYALYANQDVVQIGEMANINGNLGGEALIELKKMSRFRGDVVGGDDILIDGMAYVWGDAIAAGQVTLKKGARVAGEIVSNATIPPISQVSVSISACESDVSVGRWQFVSLPPGCYGQLKVGERAILKLTAGHYTLEKVEVSKGAMIWFDLRDGGQVVIDVAGSVELQERVWMATNTGSASGILYRVAGSDLKLGRFGRFLGTFIAPDAHFDLGLGARLTGAVYARKVQIEKWSGVTPDPALDLFVEMFLQ